MTYSKPIAVSLLSIKAIGFAPTTPIQFKSGMLSPVYVDNRTFPFHPEEWQQVIKSFSTLIKELKLAFDVIAGIETAGIPHSAALGYELKKPSCFIRKKVKDHGKKSRIEGGDVRGKKVLLIEDHVTTGGSSLAGVEALREAGALVTDCLSITSYEFAESVKAFEEANVSLHTLTTFSEILTVAKESHVITDQLEESVKRWLSDPWNWTKTHQQK